MLAEFSEFSFGFAFTNEYIASNPGLVAAPELPSLVREAEKGYDLKLSYRGHSKFFQFKLSAYMIRSSAMHWMDHNRSHYRIRVASVRKSGELSQHLQLKCLAQSTPNVVYIAPKFHTEAEFNDLFLSRRVVTNSLWAPLEDLPCGDDGKPHYLTFTKNRFKPKWHSEAHDLEGTFTAEEHYEMIHERATIDEQYFRRLRANLRDALNEPATGVHGDLIDNDELVDVLRDTHRLLTTRFGLHMVTLTDPSQEG